MGILDDNLDVDVKVLEKVLIMDLIKQSDYINRDKVNLDTLVYMKPGNIKHTDDYILFIVFDHYQDKFVARWAHFDKRYRVGRVGYRILKINGWMIFFSDFQKSKKSYDI